MEFTEDFIKEQGLSEDQVKGITAITDEQFADKQKEWEGKANENAEKIIDGAIKFTQKQTGFELSREQGEKAGDYFNRFSEKFLESSKGKVETLKLDYEQKIKDFKGGDALQSELTKAKDTLDKALEKYADYDSLKEKADKAETYGKELSGLKLEVAFGGAKPTFPDTVNKYEAKAIWREFKANVLLKNTIEIVDGIPMAIDKENHYKSTKLEELVSKDENIQKLLEGRKQEGTGAKETEFKEIEGVPFKVPEDANALVRSKLIKEQLAKEGIDSMHKSYSIKFAELNKKILEGKKL